MTGRERDETLVRAVEAEYDRAWNAADVEALRELFTDNAVVVNPLGEVAYGKAEIGASLASFLNGPGQGSVHESRITRVVFVTPNVAVVDGEATIIAPDRADIQHRFTDVLVNENGDWRISNVRAYALIERDAMVRVRPSRGNVRVRLFF